MLLLNLIFSILLLLFACVIIYMGVNIPIGLAKNFAVSAGAFPVLMGVLMLILSIWWLVDTLMELKRKKNLPEPAKKVSAIEEIFGDRKQRRNLILISALIIVYTFVLIPICGGFTRKYGFTIASFLFLTVSIKLFNSISWIRTIIISAVTVLLIFAVFHYGLLVVMPT